MRRLAWILILSSICGCSSFSAPAPYPKGAEENAAALEFEGAAVANDYGNKLTL